MQAQLKAEIDMESKRMRSAAAGSAQGPPPAGKKNNVSTNHQEATSLKI